jgi:uncharacterized RmlC-like cupin family protein
MPSKPESRAETPPRIVTVSAAGASDSRQALPLFFGVSGRSAGAKGISMYKVVIPPGAVAEPHCHKDFETAIYVIKGRVETRFGPGLRDSVVNGPGDFVYIPPDLPHQPVNLSDSEPAEAIVARNDPSEQENVVPYDPDAETA